MPDRWVHGWGTRGVLCQKGRYMRRLVERGNTGGRDARALLKLGSLVVCRSGDGGW